jgi:hypothetical protein
MTEGQGPEGYMTMEASVTRTVQWGAESEEEGGTWEAKEVGRSQTIGTCGPHFWHLFIVAIVELQASSDLTRYSP